MVDVLINPIKIQEPFLLNNLNSIRKVIQQDGLLINFLVIL